MDSHRAMRDKRRVERIADELASDLRVASVKITGDRSVVRAFMPGTRHAEVRTEAGRIGRKYGVAATAAFTDDDAGRSCWAIVARRHA